jgi:hypothetical protein
MTGIDLIGWLAAGLTLLTFSMNRMSGLRRLAVASNISFILFGLFADIMPVLVLHLLLLPCNMFRLYQIRAALPQQNQVPGGAMHDQAAAGAQVREPDNPQGRCIIFTGSSRLGEVRNIIPPDPAR